MDAPRPDVATAEPPLPRLRREVDVPCRHERRLAVLSVVGLALMMLTTSVAMFMRGSGARPVRVERRTTVELRAAEHVAPPAASREQRMTCGATVRRASADPTRAPVAETCLP